MVEDHCHSIHHNTLVAVLRTPPRHSGYGDVLEACGAPMRWEVEYVSRPRPTVYQNVTDAWVGGEQGIDWIVALEDDEDD